MPVTISKKKSGGYSVRTPNGVKSKGTTKAKAKSQERLLNAVDHGWRPTHKSNMKKPMKKAATKKASKPGDRLKAFAAKLAAKKSKSKKK